MDWMTIFERFGPLGIAVLYFVRKEVQHVNDVREMVRSSKQSSNDIRAADGARSQEICRDADGMEEDQEATPDLVTAAKTLLTDIGAIPATATYNGSALISKGARATERRK